MLFCICLNGLKLKMSQWWFVSDNTQLLASQDINYGLSGVDYLWIIVMFYQLFGLSFWRHPFTAEHPLVSSDTTL